MCAGLVVGAAGSSAIALPTPFHPEQCDLAISEGTTRVEANPGDLRAVEIMAEGLLCRGVECDDPWALNDSIELLRRVRDAGAANFFTQLYLAEALWRRYPYSVFAIGEFEEAEGMLDSGRPLADAERFRRHIRLAIESIRDTVSRTATSLRRIDERSTDVAAAPEDMADGLVILATTGAAGYRSASLRRRTLSGTTLLKVCWPQRRPTEMPRTATTYAEMVTQGWP